ncbi:MAG: 16S rRNA (guanine(527)-N(7))-methyltransferase RsmG [Flexistipes sinusarabici]|uniref:Ribosomal RNA small subunit methyltransferase G n=1 Tax=Flexistipes sinusarabici TaxID=2352 RepID=A0A5D0MGY7_FLESI|nr:16S rRNA (guanine(527)-N(7))-methyltransferase RsmG [Flexistipes sinusarabici]TYB32286.1 MAG: 16S rRNA (guanine(527)-N(7))-methyltransferase RsmG [Flexistipes sinusarabici]
MDLNNWIPVDSTIEDKLHLIYEKHMDSVHNLTSIKDKDEFFIKHYLDSIYIFRMYGFKFETVMDVGSGGGFPGVAIALFNPESTVYLVESIRKKCDFLEELVNDVQLGNVEVINSRVEDLSEPVCDLIVSRGVGKIKNVIKWTMNVSRETSCWLFYKGENVFEEIKDADKIFKKKKMRFENVRVEKPFKRTYTIINYIQYNF